MGADGVKSMLDSVGVGTSSSAGAKAKAKKRRGQTQEPNAAPKEANVVVVGTLFKKSNNIPTSVFFSDANSPE